MNFFKAAFAIELTLFRTGLLGAVHGWGGGSKKPLPRTPTSLKSVTHILQWWNLAQLYLTSSRSKNIWITWHTTPLEFCWHQHFFIGNQQILQYQEIQAQITCWYIISNSFNLFWVFKDYFNENGCNFDDASKNGYSMPS